MRRRRPSQGLLVVLLSALLAGCSAELPAAPTFSELRFDPGLGVVPASLERLESGTYVQVIREGGGNPVTSPSQGVRLSYTLHLVDGTFIQREEAAEFRLSGTIPGFRAGVMGMREGGERILVVPPELAYGARGAGQIPQNAWLVFRVELVVILSG